MIVMVVLVCNCIDSPAQPNLTTHSHRLGTLKLKLYEVGEGAPNKISHVVNGLPRLLERLIYCQLVLIGSHQLDMKLISLPYSLSTKQIRTLCD